MPKLLALVQGEALQPPENFGCTCASCKARWQRRLVFQNRVVVHMATKNMSLSASEIWQHSIELANIADQSGLIYESIDLDLCQFFSEEDLKNHPEILQGRPPGASLQ